MSKADLILHPIRMRILMTVAGRRLTTAQIAAALSDVPQATLYRHIQTLVQAEILVVAEERPVRGAVEKVYALDDGSARIGMAEALRMSKDDHLRLFTAFVMGLIGEFERYLNREDARPALEIGYQKLPLQLSEDDLRKLGAELSQVLLNYAHQPPAPERRTFYFSTVLMPGDEMLPMPDEMTPSTDDHPQADE